VCPVYESEGRLLITSKYISANSITLDLLPRYPSFAGYGYNKQNGEIEWLTTPIAFKDPSDNFYSWGMTNRKLVHCDFVRFLKKGE
jgi:hypothetical protein